jgi:hypothetical protein
MGLFRRVQPIGRGNFVGCVAANSWEGFNLDNASRIDMLAEAFVWIPTWQPSLQCILVMLDRSSSVSAHGKDMMVLARTIMIVNYQQWII